MGDPMRTHRSRFFLASESSVLREEEQRSPANPLIDASSQIVALKDYDKEQV